MDSASVSVLVGEISDCLDQLIKILEGQLQSILQYQIPPVAQNDRAQQTGAVAFPFRAVFLPDLSNLADLESILSLRESENLIFDDDDSLLDIEGLSEVVMSIINDDLEISETQFFPTGK
ncbi:putative uncharacterized protein TRPC5OS [Oryctolagus cuniculus]|uniref:TRPC5 opposite strand n=1 Tax=Oryctolagus cuniculus TaxID=9986 RepID=A0A5F9CR32_RABIT